MARGNDTEPTPITIEMDGKQHHGFYRVESGVVTVTTLEGKNATQIGGSTVEIVARMLLRELVRQGRG